MIFVLTLSLGLIKTPWKFSYLDLFQNLKTIKTERQQTEQIKNDIARTKSDLTAKEQILKDLDKDFAVQKEALKIQGKFDLPSLLVVLDQGAKKRNLELTIYYDLMTSSDKQPGQAPNAAKQPAGKQTAKNDQQVSKEQNNPGGSGNQASSSSIKSNPPASSQTPNSSNNSNPPNSNQPPNPSSSTASLPSNQKPSDNQASNSGTKQVPDFGLKEKLSEAGAPASDLKTIVLPVSVSGDFKSIRSYLTYLQGLNYVRIYAVKIQSDRADVVLQVFSVGQ